MTTFSGGGLGLGTAVLVLDVDGSKLQTEIERDLKVAAAKIKAFGKDIETSFSGHAKALSKSFGDIGTQATQLGAVVSKAFLPIGVGLGLGVKAAIDFESSFAGVKKTVNATDAEFVKLAQSFRDLSKVIPINVNELNNIGAAAGALGIKKENIVEFTETMALLGVTTNLTSDQAATSIAQIQNIFNAAGKDTKNFASALVALGNDGASTEAQIVDFATRLAAAGHQIGLSEQQVLGFGAALANVGLNAELGGTALSSVMSKMSVAVDKGGKKLDEFARIAGMTSQAFAALFKKDASKAILAYIEGLGRAGKAGENLTIALNNVGLKGSNVQDVMKRLAGAGDQVRTALDLSAKAWRENTALTVEAQKRFETTEAKLTLFWNRLKDVGITFGNALLPAINSLLDVFDGLLPILDRLAAVFAELPGPVQAVAIGIGLIGVSAGPVLIIFGQMAKGASALAALFSTLAATATTAAIAEDALAVSGETAAAATAGMGPAAASAAAGVTILDGVVTAALSKLAALTAGIATQMQLLPAWAGETFAAAGAQDALALSSGTSARALLTAGTSARGFTEGVYTVVDATGAATTATAANTASVGLLGRMVGSVTVGALGGLLSILGALALAVRALTGSWIETAGVFISAPIYGMADAWQHMTEAISDFAGPLGDVKGVLSDLAVLIKHEVMEAIKPVVEQFKDFRFWANTLGRTLSDTVLGPIQDVTGALVQMYPWLGAVVGLINSSLPQWAKWREALHLAAETQRALDGMQTQTAESAAELQAQIKPDTVQDWANAWKSAATEQSAVGTSAKGAASQLAAWRAELAGLSDSSEEGRDRLGELRQQIELGVLSTKELAGQFEISEQAVKLYKSQISEAAKSHKTLIKAEKEEETELQRMQTDLNKVSVAFDKMNEAADRADEKLQFDEIGQQLDQVARRIGSTGQVLSDAFSVFGMRSRDELQEVAAEAQKAYGLIVASVGAHAPEAIEAHRKMIEAMNAATGKLDGFKFFGMTSRAELQSVADQAVLAYKDIVATVGSRAPEAIAAHQKMVDAINAATGRIPSYWETVVGPRLKQIFGDLGRSFFDVLLGMRGQSAKEHQQLAGDAIANYNRIADSAKKEFDAIAADGTKTPKEIEAAHRLMAEHIEFAHAEMQAAIEKASHPFRDTLVDLWKSLGQSIKNVFADVLNFFLGTFLKGILGALTGKGGLQQAFASFLPGLLGTAPALLGGAALPAVAAGGTFGGLVPGGAAGGGAAAGGIGSGLSGALGGLGAGGSGLLLGWLGTKLFGGAGAAAGAFGGASGAATGALIGSIVPGIGTAIGALIGGLSGIIGGLFGKTAKTKTNDLRDQVLAQFGGGGTGEGSGFATLAAQLNQATGSNALFESFLKADTPKKFADALALVNAALQENATKTAAAAAASADHSAKIDAVNAKLKEQTDALNTQMAGLNDELAKIDASEAPEEHMGAVERAARDRIAAQQAIVRSQLEAVKEAAAAAIKAIEDASVGTSDAIGAAARAAAAAAAGAAQAAHNAFTKYHDEWTYRTGAPQFMPGVEPPDSAGLGNSPYMPRPMDSGGFGMVTKPTLFLAGIHGSEQFAFSGEGKRFPESPSSTGSPQPVVIQQLTLNAPPNASPDWARRALQAIKEEARRGGAALDAARAIVRLTGATV